MEKQTIAHFSPAATIPADVAMLTVVIAGLAYTLYSPNGDVVGRVTAHGVGWPGVLAIGWICGLVLLMLIAAQLRQILFDGRRAVWIDRGEVIFLDRRWFALALGDIARFYVGPSGRFKLNGVIFERRDGSRQSIPLGPLSESGDTIIARLREAIPASQ